MDNHCITCKFCDHSEGHVCTLGRLPIDDRISTAVRLMKLSSLTPSELI